jgi:hypothetical protein
MQITLGKIIALVIAIGYMIAAIAAYGVNSLRVGIVVFFALALIWFPEEIGDHTNLRISAPTPPIIVSIFGWFFLVGMPVILYLIWR